MGWMVDLIKFRIKLIQRYLSSDSKFSKLPDGLKQNLKKSLFLPQKKFVKIFAQYFESQAKKNQYYDFGRIKMFFQNIDNKDRILVETFLMFLYPYFYGTKIFNPLTMSESLYWGDKFKINKEDIVLDLGSNIGGFSLVAGLLAKNGKVYAFDPSDNNCYFARRNLKLNGIKNVKVNQKAVTNKDGIVKFYFDKQSPASSAVVPDDFRGKLAQEVESITIDTFVETEKIKQVDFIKMDIEGSERAALKGAAKTIKRFRPKLSVCTYHLKDDIEVLPRLIWHFSPDYKIEQRVGKLFAY